MGDAEIDESCFLSTIDDIDRCTENLLRGLDKVLPIFCAPQCVGADNTQFGGRGAVDQLLESLEAGQPALYRAGGQHRSAGRLAQLHFLGQCLDRSQLSEIRFGDHQMKGIAAEVNGGE